MERLTCTATTLKKTRCTRKATHGDRCYQHAAPAGAGATVAAAAVVVTPVAPAPANAGANKNLPPADSPWPDPSGQLQRRILKKIATKQRLASRPGKEGYVYVYSLQHEVGKDYWKVGMTERNDYRKRLKEWTTVHAPAIVVCKAVYYTTANCKLLERLIHLYLDYCRMYRYPTDNPYEMVTVWKTNGKPVDAVVEAKPHQVVAKNKHKEWFNIDWPKLEELIQRLRACVS